MQICRPEIMVAGPGIVMIVRMGSIPFVMVVSILVLLAVIRLAMGMTVTAKDGQADAVDYQPNNRDQDRPVKSDLTG